MDAARKTLIGAAFDAAVDQYEASAYVQRIVAQNLVDMVGPISLRPGARILEIGCGTGLLTRKIQARWPDAELTATDIAPHMVDAVARAGLATRRLVMDGEAPVFEGPQFDLILSSLTFQWFDGLPRALTRLAPLLHPGGGLHFATMGAQSFTDWRIAHEMTGQSVGLPDYPDLADLRTMLAEYGGPVACEAYHTLPMRGGSALIRHFREIGAHVPKPSYRPLGPAAMRRVIQKFDARGGEARYHILYGRITRI